MKILQFPNWFNRRDDSVSQAPPEPFKPSPTVIRAYAKDIEKHGEPLDSGLPDYFRKVADYYEARDIVGSSSGVGFANNTPFTQNKGD